MAEVIIYSKTYCPFCVKAKTLLDSKSQNYIEHNIETDNEKAIEMMEKTKGARTVPQIFIDGKHIGGCDDLYELNDDGGLDPLLAV